MNPMKKGLTDPVHEVDANSAGSLHAATSHGGAQTKSPIVVATNASEAPNQRFTPRSYAHGEPLNRRREGG